MIRGLSLFVSLRAPTEELAPPGVLVLLGSSCCCVGECYGVVKCLLFVPVFLSGVSGSVLFLLFAYG